MPILTDPVAADTQARLRRVVLGFRREQHRRIYPSRIVVGDPDGLHHRFEVPARPARSRRGPTVDTKLIDAAQRADVVGALLEGYLMAGFASTPLLWVIRPGPLDGVHDIDADWVAAGHQAFAECRVELTMVVITRQGWSDPRSGVTRRWKRLRAH